MKFKILATTVTLVLLIGCRKEKVQYSGNIKDHFFLENNGATMPVYVEGNINSNKILIMVHGGPGDGALYYNTEEATNIAEKDFAMAYWDQRLAGITQGNKADVSLKAYTEDLGKLIVLLRSRYGQSKKIYLIGHSWGGFLVPLFLKEGNNQSLVNGWIQVDGIHNYALNDELTRSSLIEFGNKEITANRHVEEWQKIVDYCVGNDPTGNYKVGRKLNDYAHEAEDLIDDIHKGKSTFKSIKYFVREYRFPITSFLSNGVYNHFIKKIDEQAYAETASSKLGTITLPTLLLWGKYDFICPSSLKDDLQNNISSTDLTSKIFDNSGHNAMTNEPVAFWTTVRDWMQTH